MATKQVNDAYDRLIAASKLKSNPLHDPALTIIELNRLLKIQTSKSESLELAVKELQKQLTQIRRFLKLQ